MSFWNLSNGALPEENGSFEMSNGEPLPKGDYIALIKDVEKRSFEGTPEFYQIRWQVLKPETYKNQIVFQKLHVNDPKQKRRDDAIGLLMAINVNTGSKLPTDIEPTEDDMKKAFCNRMMTIRVEIWEIDGKKGNWVSKVAPKASSVPEPKPSRTIEDDVPF